MIKYKTTSQSRSKFIQEVDVERQFGGYIWINGWQVKARNEFEVYHDSWEDAHTYLLLLAEENVQKELLAYNTAKEDLAYIINMKKPQS